MISNDLIMSNNKQYLLFYKKVNLFKNKNYFIKNNIFYIKI